MPRPLHRRPPCPRPIRGLSMLEGGGRHPAVWPPRRGFVPRRWTVLEPHESEPPFAPPSPALSPVTCPSPVVSTMSPSPATAQHDNAPKKDETMFQQLAKFIAAVMNFLAIRKEKAKNLLLRL